MCGACRPPSPSGSRPGLRVKIAELPGGSTVGDPGVAAETRVGRRAARVLGRRKAAVGVGLPGLDHRVGHDVAGAVEHPAADPEAALGPSAAAQAPSGQVSPIARYGPTVALGVVPSRKGSVEEAGAALPGRRLVRLVEPDVQRVDALITRHLRRRRSRGRLVRPRSTMSHSNASAQLSCVRSSRSG